MEFFTIGVFNSLEDKFFSKMINARIDTFCDIRQRRGVRGAKYSFVNSLRLQERLSGLDITYVHNKRLAPTKEIRDLQKADDQRKGELKRRRTRLGTVFSNEYANRILRDFDFDKFIIELENLEAHRVILFCVEERPEACHRSIVANELERRFGYRIRDL